MSRLIEDKKRTIVKGIILRVIIFLLTTIVILIKGGSLMDSIELGMLDVVLELGTHYVYERMWQYIDWGMSYQKSF